MIAIAEPDRCGAAHPADPSSCDGPPAVMVLDAHNAGTRACEHHGAALLASLKDARVYGLETAEPGTAIRVWKKARSLQPFPWATSSRAQADSIRAITGNAAR